MNFMQNKYFSLDHKSFALTFSQYYIYVQLSPPSEAGHYLNVLLLISYVFSYLPILFPFIQSSNGSNILF